MASFVITVENDNSYNKVMTYLISNSVTFSKDNSFGPIKIEVQGNSNDYTYFKQQIESGMILAHLQEVL